MSSDFIPHCPRCRMMDQTQKVSAIVASGSSQAMLSGYAYTFDDSVSINLGGSKQTALSKMLSPLPKPYRISSLKLLFANQQRSTSVIVLLTMGSVAALLASISEEGPFSVYGWIAIVCLGLVSLSFLGCLSQAHNNNKQFPVAYAHWQRAAQNWQNLYYCHRCDCAFIPNSTILMSSSQVKDFLYRS